MSDSIFEIRVSDFRVMTNVCLMRFSCDIHNHNWEGIYPFFASCFHVPSGLKHRKGSTQNVDKTSKSNLMKKAFWLENRQCLEIFPGRFHQKMDFFYKHQMNSLKLAYRTSNKASNILLVQWLFWIRATWINLNIGIWTHRPVPYTSLACRYWAEPKILFITSQYPGLSVGVKKS